MISHSRSSYFTFITHHFQHSHINVYSLTSTTSPKLVQIDALDCALNDMLANLHNFGILFFYGIFRIPWDFLRSLDTPWTLLRSLETSWFTLRSLNNVENVDSIDNVDFVNNGNNILHWLTNSQKHHTHTHSPIIWIQEISALQKSAGSWSQAPMEFQIVADRFDKSWYFVIQMDAA